MILYSISIPNFDKMAEKNKGEAAKFNLVAIYNAEKRHKLDKGQYYSCAAPCSIATLNSELGILISDHYFDYGVILSLTGFEATAIRKEKGVCGGKKIKVTNENSAPVKDCSVW